MIPDAVADEGLCIGFRAGLPASAWDADADPSLRRLAIGTCERCPALAACGSWLASLPRSKRPTGVVAGRRLGSDGPVRVTVRAGLATATAAAQPPVARRNGRDLTRKRLANAAYHRTHRELILARKQQRWREVRDEVNARRRAARAASL